MTERKRNYIFKRRNFMFSINGFVISHDHIMNSYTILGTPVHVS